MKINNHEDLPGLGEYYYCIRVSITRNSITRNVFLTRTISSDCATDELLNFLIKYSYLFMVVYTSKEAYFEGESESTLAGESRSAVKFVEESFIILILYGSVFKFL